MVNIIYKNYRVTLLFFFIVSLLSIFPQSPKAEINQYGDGIAFPHSCVDFSGIWVNEIGDKFIQIEQEQCKTATITFTQGESSVSIVVQLDGMLRTIYNSAKEFHTLTCSWDSIDHGAIMEILLHYHFMGQNRILFINEAKLSYEEAEDGVLSVNMQKEVHLNGKTIYRKEGKKELFHRVKEK